MQQADGDAEEDDYELELPADPVCKIGDIWQLGRHRLMVGDSTDPRYVNALMGGEQADLLVTDPPYNVDYEGSNGKKIQNDSMDERPVPAVPAPGLPAAPSTPAAPAQPPISSTPTPRARPSAPCSGRQAGSCTAA